MPAALFMRALSFRGDSSTGVEAHVPLPVHRSVAAHMHEDLHVGVSDRHRATGGDGAHIVPPALAHDFTTGRSTRAAGSHLWTETGGARESMATKKITIAKLASLRARGDRAVFVTAYDYPTAAYADRAGVDLILVGDSAAMTMLGLPNTLGIGMTEMLVFARAVSRAVTHALVIGDMPFRSYQPSDECAIRNAAAFIADAGCDAVKCEGGSRVAPRVRAM